jgi:hypothetical protein
MRSLWPILLLAVTWAVGPALGPLLNGQLLGHGLTDLYPSVWGLWAFAEAQPGLPSTTHWLGFPDGMGYAYSSPIKGWIATPLLPVLGLKATWNLLLVAARGATVLCAFGAARAWGLTRSGALVAAAVYGCSPFFHGYAVEGIVEGTDGWTLALWLWAIGRGRYRLAAIPFALTIVSSWYLGMAACLLAAMALVRDRRVAWSGLGLVLASPALIQFFSAFSGGTPLDDTVRAMMGATLTLPRPGVAAGLNPFAINTYVGFTVTVLAVASRTRWVLAAMIPACLSLGIGPIYELPVAEMVRFPYRWHAATLILLAPAAAVTASRLSWGAWLAPLIVIEGLLLSPVEPLIPGADARVPEHVQHIKGPVLDLPGPIAMPPGKVNRSRGRARYLMYHQTMHGQPSPWVPDFNSVGVKPSAHAELMAPFIALDKLSGADMPDRLPFAQIASTGVSVVVLHHRELGRERTRFARAALEAQGWAPANTERDVSVYRQATAQ